MADRITAMRKALTAALSAQNVPGDWSFITSQIGMFSYLGEYESRHMAVHFLTKLLNSPLAVVF